MINALKSKLHLVYSSGLVIVGLHFLLVGYMSSSTYVDAYDCSNCYLFHEEPHQSLLFATLMYIVHGNFAIVPPASVKEVTGKTTATPGTSGR